MQNSEYTSNFVSFHGREPKEFFQDVKCEKCGEMFKASSPEHPLFSGRPWLFTTHCARCTAELEAEKEQKRIRKQNEETLRRWSEICPALYRTTKEFGDTDEDRLLREVPKSGEILASGFSQKGLLIRGDSGKGKTRIMWRLLRSYFDRGKSIQAFTSGAFERAYRDAAGKFQLTEWFDSIVESDCVFIDDLGKSPWSPATTSTFFDVIESRSSTRKPMYITTNLSGETLLQQLKLEKDIGEPMIRRLREFCELIVL